LIHGLLLCVLLFVSGETLLGLTVRLKDGSLISGEVVSSDDDSLTLLDWQTGGIVRIPWSSLEFQEADRLRELVKPPAEREEPMLDGILLTMEDGKTHEGIVEQQSPEKYTLRTATGIRHVPRNRVMKTEAAKIRALAVYSAKEFYDMKLQTTDATSAKSQCELASLCKQMGLYDEAKEHLTKAMELDSSLSESVQKQITAIDKLVDESKAAALYVEADKAISQRKFSNAKELLQQLIDSYPATEAGRKGPAMLAKIDKDEEAYLADRRKFVDTKIVPAYYQALATAIYKQTDDKKITLAEIMKYVETGLQQGVFSTLATKFSIEAAEIENIWKARQVSETRTASYGDGTFIVEKFDAQAVRNEILALPMEKRGQLLAELAQRENTDMNAAGEDWWKKAAGQRRVSWMQSYAAETFLETVETKYVVCIGCNGKKWTAKYELCKRCMAIGKDKLIVYR
jgi:hypothetical protein